MVKKQREAKLATLGLQVAFGTQLARRPDRGDREGRRDHRLVPSAQTIAKVLGIAIVALAVAVTVYNVASKVAAVATAAWKAATWLLNAALDANPIALVVIAIAALVAALIYAYKHSETFRNIVNGMWATLKEVAAWMVTAGVNAFHAVANASGSRGVSSRPSPRRYGAASRRSSPALWASSGRSSPPTSTVTGRSSPARGTRSRTATRRCGARSGPRPSACGTPPGHGGNDLGRHPSAILTPIRAVRDLLGGKGRHLVADARRRASAWEKIKTGAGTSPAT
jgi:hypothetical protein